MLVYKARCKSTGLVYIGCTTKRLEDRKLEHHIAAMNGSPFKFHKALRELGLSSFEWSEVVRCATKADMFTAERVIIQRYNSFKNGLNSTPGGVGSASDGRRAAMKMPQKKPYQPKPRKLYARY